MRPSRLAKKLTLVFAMLAIVMSSLMPLMSHAFRSTPAGWIEVCTSLGAKWVDAADARDGTSAPTKAPVDHAQAHCPYCSSHLAQLGMPPAAAAALPLSPVRLGLPPIFFSATRTPFAWAQAQPRAPPHRA
ncbi:MAG: DUF2946 domain-containing protein [Gammaproteobacteria bacterium]|nr:DUF2946 domain-containing protein [Gammaproteobacteria bacterium]MBU1444223.1 DUF2946 domain-containing protein [Gammaproteobacteria bacterium]MBU2286091.1 DUF2946 domain-containing protein [Gammaproteobacteria bacterium]MBU2410860.1 DUF2946 domain-containing protein [Gammaproteobacteria bacterium]